MKKVMIVLVALSFSACVETDFSSILSNPTLINDQVICIKDKNPQACLRVADELTKGTKNQEDLDKIKHFYNLACTFGSIEGCNKFKQF